MFHSVKYAYRNDQVTGEGRALVVKWFGKEEVTRGLHDQVQSHDCLT